MPDFGIFFIRKEAVTTPKKTETDVVIGSQFACFKQSYPTFEFSSR